MTYLRNYLLRPALAYLLLQMLRRLYRLAFSPNLLLRTLPNSLGERLAHATPSLQHSYTPSSCVYYFGLLSTALYPAIRKLQFTYQPKYVRQTFQLPEFRNTHQPSNLPWVERDRHPEILTCCPEVVPPGEVSLDWAGAPEERADAIYIVVPGLTGCSNESYIRCFVRYMEINCPKSRVACYNPRGRGGNPITSDFLYSGGYTQDLRRVIQHVHANIAGARPIFLVGYSLGGNVVTKMIGEDGDRCLVRGAAVCSPPLDFLSMSNHLTTSWIGQLLDAFLVYSCNRELTSDPTNVDRHFFQTIRRKRPTTMCELDHNVIAPMMELTSASHYYRLASGGQWLHKIRIPMLFVLPEDDPLVDGERVRRDDFETNPCLVGVFTKYGGHSMDLPEAVEEGDRKSGSRNFFQSRSWFDKIVVEFTNAVLEEGGTTKASVKD